MWWIKESASSRLIWWSVSDVGSDQGWSFFFFYAFYEPGQSNLRNIQLYQWQRQLSVYEKSRVNVNVH